MSKSPKFNIGFAHIESVGPGFVAVGEGEINAETLIIKSQSAGIVSVPAHSNIPVELVHALKAEVDRGATVSDLEPSLLSQFAARGLDLVDWAGRGLTLAEIYQYLIG